MIIMMIMNKIEIVTTVIIIISIVIMIMRIIIISGMAECSVYQLPSVECFESKYEW